LTPETDAARLTERNGCVATYQGYEIVTAKFARSLEKERFTIYEIADYIAGWHLSTESGALANALSQLNDDQDGILAVRERKHYLENAESIHPESKP
jgi:hypothetical protein